MKSQTVIYTLEDGTIVQNSGWFYSTVKKDWQLKGFGIGEAVLVCIEQFRAEIIQHTMVHVMSKDLTAASVSISEAKAHLQSVRDFAGNVLFVDDQKNVCESWQVATGILN